ncbi:MAG: hypothetical protein QOD72_3209 [Acidimicrobiaceae bacterium]|jgi:RNA polymerase sigma factor (sigma-70 family)|nr:hypothetical protein [Acidimicrobiaceae bacterium]
MTSEHDSTRPNHTDTDLRTRAAHGNDHVRLVERAKAKDPEAINELIAMFRPLVERVARRRCSRKCEVDDVVQDVWMALLTSLDSIHSPACLPGWLRRVTVNVTIEHGKKNRAVPLADVPERLRVYSVHPATPLARAVSASGRRCMRRNCRHLGTVREFMWSRERSPLLRQGIPTASTFHPR